MWGNFTKHIDVVIYNSCIPTCMIIKKKMQIKGNKLKTGDEYMGMHNAIR